MSTHTLDSSRRRDELYGEKRKEAARQLRSVLTADHIGDHVKHLKGRDTFDHDADLRWKSITKWTFRGEQPSHGDKKKIASPRTQRLDMLNTTHFDLGFDTANIDENIYKASMTNADYDSKNVPPMPPRKQDDTINLPDFAPKYMSDKGFGTTYYSSVFGDKLRDVDRMDPMSARAELRQSNVDDLRSTHFRFGTDPEHYLSETNVSYHHGRRASGHTAKSLPDTKELALRMQLEEHDSAVFRFGDYNMRKSLPMMTTNHRDFNNRLYVPKHAEIEDESIRAKLPTLTSTKQVRFADEVPPSRDFPSITSLLDFKKACMLHDREGTGRLGREELRSLCTQLELPLPDPKVDDVLTEVGQDADGTVNYTEFINRYGMIPIPEKITGEKKDEGDATAVKLPKLTGHDPTFTMVGQGRPIDWRSLRYDNDALGKRFHTTAHFKFGTDAEGPASIYNKDYLDTVPQGKPIQHPPPISSKVMHEVPGIGFGNTVNKTEYINYQLHLPERLKELRRAHESQVKKNHDKLSSAHVVLTCDFDRHTEDRQLSLSHGDFVGPPSDFRPMAALTAQPAKYRYLDSEGALSFPPPAPKRSEAKEAYTQFNDENIDGQRILSNKGTCKERVSDGKDTHFLFGSDQPLKVSEARDQYDGRPVVKDGKRPAGIRNAPDSSYQHIRVSDNTQDTEVTTKPNITDLQARLRTIVSTKHKNPRDPLNVNLRKAFLEYDKDLTGVVSRDDIKRVCSKFSLDLHEGLLDKLIDKCDSTGDGKINYYEFAEHLTLPRTPGAGYSPVHTASIMQHDYRPLNSRSFTDSQMLTIDHMNKKTPRPMASHLFHTDTTGDKNLTSTTSMDFIKPEMMTGRRSLPAL